MLKCFVLSAVLLAAVAAVPTENLHPLSDEYIAEINKKASTWVAGKNFEVEEYDHVKKMLGALTRDSSLADDVDTIRNPHNEDQEIPESFDAREQWPDCESIKELRDQSGCGSCWAVAATAAMSDRICIHSNSTKQTRVSSEDLTACCWLCGFGCDGGYPQQAWAYWRSSGIVTGGLYEAKQGCKDYTLKPCEHHTDGPRPQCSTLNYKTPSCTKKCEDSSLSYGSSKTFGLQVNYLENEKQIQLEVLKNGPIEVSFTVMSDFLSYKSGIYQPTVRTQEGGHAVRLIGWGVENNIKYWLITNSWNTDWGEQGLFRIIRGVDSCGIESSGVASLPKV